MMILRRYRPGSSITASAPGLCRYSTADPRFVDGRRDDRSSCARREPASIRIRKEMALPVRDAVVTPVLSA